MALESTQPLTETSTRILFGGGGGKERPARKADNLATICEPIFLENVGASTSHNSVGLHRLLQGSFAFVFGINLRAQKALKSQEYIRYLCCACVKGFSFMGSWYLAHKGDPLTLN
jgi:hypothetical protein